MLTLYMSFKYQFANCWVTKVFKYRQCFEDLYIERFSIIIMYNIRNIIFSNFLIIYERIIKITSHLNTEVIFKSECIVCDLLFIMKIK